MRSAFTPVCGYDIIIIIFTGDVYCPNTKCLVNFACTKRLFNLLAETIINVRNVGFCARCAIFLLKVKQIVFFVAWSRGLNIWREPRIRSKFYWRCLSSWQVLSQQREKRIFWWLCNNSEIHLRLWNLWSLVVCSQSSFYVTRAREDDKNRQNTIFFFARKRWN